MGAQREGRTFSPPPPSSPSASTTTPSPFSYTGKPLEKPHKRVVQQKRLLLLSGQLALRQDSLPLPQHLTVPGARDAVTDEHVGNAGPDGRDGRRGPRSGRRRRVLVGPPTGPRRRGHRPAVEQRLRPVRRFSFPEAQCDAACYAFCGGGGGGGDYDSDGPDPRAADLDADASARCRVG